MIEKGNFNFINQLTWNASENVKDASHQGFRNIVEALQNDVTKIRLISFPVNILQESGSKSVKVRALLYQPWSVN